MNPAEFTRFSAGYLMRKSDRTNVAKEYISLAPKLVREIFDPYGWTHIFRPSLSEAVEMLMAANNKDTTKDAWYMRVEVEHLMTILRMQLYRKLCVPTDLGAYIPKWVAILIDQSKLSTDWQLRERVLDVFRDEEEQRALTTEW